jgi:hypothetical protein
MAGRGRRYTFHGVFSSKAKARRKERAHPGSFIREFRILGYRRYVVMKGK